MAKVDLDARGMKCPMPALKMNSMLLKSEVKQGDVIEAFVTERVATEVFA